VGGAEDASAQALHIRSRQRRRSSSHAARQPRLLQLRRVAPRQRHLGPTGGGGGCAVRQQLRLCCEGGAEVERAQHGGARAQRPSRARLLLAVCGCLALTLRCEGRRARGVSGAQRVWRACGGSQAAQRGARRRTVATAARSARLQRRKLRRQLRSVAQGSEPGAARVSACASSDANPVVV
jgi:hypothetical protein